jgi:hypothetical protein
MEILIGLFIIAVIVVLYNIFTTTLPEESYLVPKKTQENLPPDFDACGVDINKSKVVEEHFEDALDGDSFRKEDIINILEVKEPKKYLQKRERKTLKHIVKDK